MDDPVPLASQPANSYPIIFQYPTEIPIPLFVEASKIPERPKLIRSLIRHGASICTSPADAHIILVDSSTDPGLQFVRDWSGDDKVILEYSWAFKCITAGRPLLRDDNFANCMAVDDGRAYEVDVDNDGAENPLPTPRPTPSDAGQSTTQSRGRVSTQSKPDPGPHRASTDIPVKKDLSPPLNTYMSPTTQTLQPSQYQTQIPPSQVSSQFQQSQQWAQFNPTQQFPLPQPLPIEFNNPFAQPGPSTQMPQPSPITPSVLYAGFMDYMRLQAGFQSSPMPLNNMHPAQMQQIFMAQQTNSSFVPPRFGASQSVSIPLSPTVNGQPVNVASLSPPVGPHSSSPQICEPSISRRSPLPETLPSPTPLGTSKGKEKAISGSTKRKRTPPKHAYVSSEDENIGIFVPPVTKVPEDRLRKEGEIFRSLSGEQLLFFVQVDLPGRAGTVRPIRKHGGKMVGSISDADFVVLGYPQSSTYKDLIAQAQACNKVPLKSTFVADCIKHMTLLDQEPYALQGVPSTKRQRTSSAAVKVETPKKSTQMAETFMAGRSLSPGPTPPPLNTRVVAMTGKFKYPPEEINWFKKFARFHLERDPKISNTMLFKLVHEKMSHHSANAWQNYISREFPNELDTIRKRVGIARRKATHTNDSLHSNSSINAEVGPSKPRLDLATVEAMAVDKPSLADNDWKLDFQDICTFFANSSAHEESDDATVWASLEAETKCRTAPSWPEFYTGHEKEIVEEIDRLVDLLSRPQTL